MNNEKEIKDKLLKLFEEIDRQSDEQELRDSTDPVFTDKVRSARIGVMKLINNLGYRVSIPEPGIVHVFRGEAL